MTELTQAQGGICVLLDFRSTEVVRSTEKSEEVPRSPKKSLEVPGSPEKYRKVQRSTHEDFLCYSFMNNKKGVLLARSMICFVFRSGSCVRLDLNFNVKPEVLVIS